MTAKQKLKVLSPLLVFFVITIFLSFKNVLSCYDIVEAIVKEPPTVGKTLRYLNYSEGVISPNKLVLKETIVDAVCCYYIPIIFQCIFTFAAFAMIPTTLIQFKLCKDYKTKYGEKDPTKVQEQIEKCISIVRIYAIVYSLVFVVGIYIADGVGYLQSNFMPSIVAMADGYSSDSVDAMLPVAQEFSLIQCRSANDGIDGYLIPEELFGGNPIPSEVTFKSADIKVILSESSNETYSLEALNAKGLNTANLSDTKYYLYCKE